MNAYKGLLAKNFIIDNKYTVLLFIKKGRNAETYRVKDTTGKIFFLKLFDFSELKSTSFDENHDLLEVVYLKQSKHKNIVKFIDDGELVYSNRKYIYLVLGYIPGETLAERIAREALLNYYDVKEIMTGILDGLHYLHNLKVTIIHNEITPDNIMLDLTDEVPVPVIIDFGYARSFHQSTKVYDREGLNLTYVAPECLNNYYSPQSDLYSAGVIMYHLIFGIPPWNSQESDYIRLLGVSHVTFMKDRDRERHFPPVSPDFIGFDENVYQILEKALSSDLDYRFGSCEDFIKALNGEVIIENSERKGGIKIGDTSKKKINSENKPSGFNAVAGLQVLKNEMQRSVIDILKNPEKAQKYGAKIPNGMILYGPPGCGKTYFAKQFAEEVGFNFILATPSTLKSKYVNATQENIAKMFGEAEKKAPTIIFIDEINELLPSRDSEVHEMSKSAVNEMLAQMDRTGEKGVFVVGACNNPNTIDPAMLRAGRLEKKFYLPPPDFELRKALFTKSLQERKQVLDFGIDYDHLVNLTENYVSADIEAIVNEATSIAMAEDQKISMQILEKVIESFSPFPFEELAKYESIKAKFEGRNIDENNDKPRIGFKI